MSLVCNFIDGGVSCALPRHRTSGGKLRTKFALHFAAEIKKWRVTGLKKLELSGSTAIIRKKIITGKSVERMRKSRNVRKETVAHLISEKLQQNY
jgi:hypothetical protein